MAEKRGIKMGRAQAQEEQIERRTDTIVPRTLRLEELETRAVPTPSIPIPPP